MNNQEPLEIHFYDGDNYNKNKVKNFIEYRVINDLQINEIIIDYINININNENIGNNIYENYDLLSKIFSNSDVINNSLLCNIIENNFITRIKFIYSNNIKSNFYVNISGNNIYYSYEFFVEDMRNEKVFEYIKPLYIDLINIFNPVVSNAGYEVLWEDIDRINNEKYFEGIYGYLKYNYKFDFISIKEKVILNEGYLFQKN